MSNSNLNNNLNDDDLNEAYLNEAIARCKASTLRARAELEERRRAVNVANALAEACAEREMEGIVAEWTAYYREHPTPAKPSYAPKPLCCGCDGCQYCSGDDVCFA